MIKRVLANISFSFIDNITTYLFSFLTLLYVTRVLQPEVFGKTSFAASFSGFFIMFANLGMPIYAMRKCAEYRDDKGKLSRVFNELWSINVILSAASFFFYVLLIMFVPRLKEDSAVLIIFGSGILFQMLGCEWLFKGLEKFKLLAVSGFIVKAASFVLILLLIHSREQILHYSLLYVLMAYGSSIICFFMLRRYVDISFAIKLNWNHFRPLLIFFVMSFAVNIYSNLDLTMLGFIKSDYEIGLYSIAAKGKSVLAMTGGLVWSSSLPLATQLWKNGDKEQFETFADKAILVVCAIQAVVTLVCLMLARPIILFVGGEDYVGAVTAFRILLLSLVPIGASNILGGQVLIPAGKEDCLLRAEIAGAVFNFFANLILIPYLSIIGAAITTLISEIIVWGWCNYYIRRDLNMDFARGLVLRALEWGMSVIKRPLSRVSSRICGDTLPYYCPCCDTYLNDFIEVKYSQRDDLFNPDRYMKEDQKVTCPVCGSLGRHRILVSYLNENIEIVRDKRIIHFAPEGSISAWMNKNDISPITADLTKPTDLSIDVMDTGLEDESFDVVIINHVIEHVADFRKALQELHRIIRRGGSIFISFPVDRNIETVYEDDEVTTEAERVKHFGQFDHLRVFGRDSTTMLEGFGFDVEEIRGDEYDPRIKPVVGPADYDYNVVWRLEKK